MAELMRGAPLVASAQQDDARVRIAAERGDVLDGDPADPDDGDPEWTRHPETAFMLMQTAKRQNRLTTLAST